MDKQVTDVQRRAIDRFAAQLEKDSERSVRKSLIADEAETLVARWCGPSVAPAVRQNMIDDIAEAMERAIVDWSFFTNVQEFHEAMELDRGETDFRPHLLAPGVMAKRLDFLAEELEELLDAVKRESVPSIADAIADAIYILLGTAVMMQLPFQDIWNAVHSSNMQKRPANPGEVGGGNERPYAQKVTKPEGWKPPDILTILLANGWTPPHPVDALVYKYRDEHPDDPDFKSNTPEPVVEE